ncbi:MAG: hypothetical protein IKM59_07305 [Oscillospiraceae bacterium]|nr:hypothetical protein [Oscillospiraceae bacterium]
MRDLKECQAEVFRRSERRIKERKKRRTHVLVACIPFVLCMTLLGVYLWPEAGPDKTAASDRWGGTLYTNLLEAPDTSTGRAIDGAVEVSGKGISHIYTAPERVQEILDFFDTIENPPKDTVISTEAWYFGFVTDHASDFFTYTTPANGLEVPGYKVTITQTDGSSTEYLLVGSSLTNQATNECFRLNEETYFALKDLLGIPLY